MNGLFLMIDTTLCFFVALIIESESYSIVGIATFDPLAALEPDSINTYLLMVCTATLLLF